MNSLFCRAAFACLLALAFASCSLLFDSVDTQSHDADPDEILDASRKDGAVVDATTALPQDAGLLCDEGFGFLPTAIVTEKSSTISYTNIVPFTNVGMTITGPNVVIAIYQGSSGNMPPTT